MGGSIVCVRSRLGGSLWTSLWNAAPSTSNGAVELALDGPSEVRRLGPDARCACEDKGVRCCVDPSTDEEAIAYYADDYVFRGSIIGPISGQEVADTQKGFKIDTAYPDLDRGIFGFTIDPQTPYRCLFFERWTATNTGEAKIGPRTLPPTGNRVETPLHVSSITWNPEGKINYNSISPPVDRFEGNTKGAGAVFGLLVGAGIDSGPASVGLPTLMLQQKIVQKLGFLGKQWSDEADVPAWWKSKARGADPNDI